MTHPSSPFEPANPQAGAAAAVNPAAAITIGKDAGWYSDPWEQAPWRWWDGAAWAAHTHDGQTGKKPKLPSWLSPLVLTASVPSLGIAALSALTFPLAILLGFTPMLLVAPVLLWMDRVEPEPWSSRIHALLWGAFVAGMIGLVSNTIVAETTSENWAAVVSAPLSEEIGKALGIYWAVRRKEVDSVMDGLIYAGWVALGFAVIENFGYFSYAGQDGTLFQTFIGRALFTPFAHPLFTAWTGLAIGRAVTKGKSIATAWWGLALAIGLHALWNGSITAAGPTDANPDGNVLVIGLVVLLFFGLFVAAIIAIVQLRGSDVKRFSEQVPFLAQRYSLTPSELEVLRDPKAIKLARKGLGKEQRKGFDRRRAAIARLACLHDRPGEIDPSTESRLMTELFEAKPVG